MSVGKGKKVWIFFKKKILILFFFVLFLLAIVYFWKHSTQLYCWLLLWDKYTKKQQGNLAYNLFELNIYLGRIIFTTFIKRDMTATLLSSLEFYLRLERDWNHLDTTRRYTKERKDEGHSVLEPLFWLSHLVLSLWLLQQPGDFLVA